MSDYEKLTVIKLRDELVKRSLPKNGLKAALIQRLQEADAQSEDADPAPKKPTSGVLDENAREGILALQEPLALTNSQDDGLGRDDANASNGAQQAPEITPQAEQNASGTGGSHSRVGEIPQAKAEPVTALQVSHKTQSPAQPSTDPSTQASFLETPVQTRHSQDDLQSEIMPGVVTQPAQEPEPSSQLPTPSQSQTEQQTMTQASATEELLEDSRKRKRRSQSPPPSSIDTQKRLKAHNTNPHVELPEDTTGKDSPSNQRTDDNVPLSGDSAPDSPPQTNGRPATTDGSATPKLNGRVERLNLPGTKQEAKSHIFPQNAESPVKPSPSDTRFKNLFTAPSNSDTTSQQRPYPDIEDRLVGPALHPATSALYIRELMRPLKVETIKHHLIALATPANTSVDPNIITEFFLDSIRTHCLVSFANTAAASRVRLGLHDRIWPNERDRRPLFVDFVPEEKLKKWIDVEQNAPSGRGHAQKKWEVVYEEEDGAITAYLQEVGTNSGGLRTAQPARADAGQGVKGAPSGPRIRESESQAAQARSDNGQGFQALDDLFKSTSAKPKLYYQPVPRATAEHRLDKLAAGRGGGRSDEMRRYTFEESLLVDKAPEYGNRGTSGYRGRAGASGGYRGRGMGYRGDVYRGTGDGWNDRRSGY